MEETHICGRVTDVALDDLRPLLLPWRQNAFGCLMPQPAPDALRLSMEMVGSAYALDVTDWLQAGWRDLTVQLDGKLQTPAAPEPAEGRSGLGALLRKGLAQLPRRLAPLGKVTDAIRQLNTGESDSGKAVVMLRPAGDGRYVVAVSFLGTVGLDDWITNLRMSADQGVHKGFLQLARQFERNEESILFPETARELGMERLSLADILREAGRPDSRFVLWLTGHSQGGALVQLYAHHKLQESGVYPQNLLGFGFASPRVAVGTLLARPDAFPLFHVINSDDVVPRSGAAVHLGQCLLYPTDDALRAACYSWPTDETSAALRAQVQPFVDAMTDMPRILELVTAYLMVLIDLPVSDMWEGLGKLSNTIMPVKHLANLADNGVDAVIRRVIRHGEEAYLSIAGHPMDAAVVAADKQAIGGVVQRIGARAFVTALTQLLAYPHASKCRPGAQWGTYPYIVCCGADRLTPAVWAAGEHPSLIEADWAHRRLTPAVSRRFAVTPVRGARIPHRAAHPKSPAIRR